MAEHNDVPKMITFSVEQMPRLPLEKWRGMVLTSARAVMTHLIRIGAIEPPIGMSSEVAQRELVELIPEPDGYDGAIAVIQISSNRDAGVVNMLRERAVLHHYSDEHAHRRSELLAILDEAAEQFRADNFEQGWRELVRWAQAWKQAGGAPEIAFWTIARGVEDCDACQVHDDPRLESLEGDPWEELFDKLTVQAFRSIGEDEMADLCEHDRDEYYRRYEVGRFELFGPLPPQPGT